MYVQPPDRGARQTPRSDVIVPKNYSGNAFRQYVGDSEAERPQPPSTVKFQTSCPPLRITALQAILHPGTVQMRNIPIS